MDAAVAPYPLQERFYFSPLKVYEYMAAGLPVVASRVGPLEETIRNGTSGLLCPPGDAAAFAAALMTLAEQPRLRAEMGREARRAVVSGHTWGAVAARILGLAGSARRAARAQAQPAAAAKGA
jgi:glycosyltransferase involved in cell wall biosynthesis